MTNPAVYGLIAIGGAAGACLRYFLSSLMMQWFGNSFPFGTLLVNVLGSLAIGLIYAVVEQGYFAFIPWRNLITIGFLGAFTTFSTFSLDTLLLLQQGQWLKGGANIMINVFCCLAAAWLGIYLIKH